jgi:hypothetical protein
VRLLVVGEIGECSVGVRLGCIGVFKQTVEERGEGSAVRVVMRYPVLGL